MTVAHPEALLLLLPLALLLLWRRRAPRRAPALVVSDLRLFELNRRGLAGVVGHLPAGLRVVALVALVLALARPQTTGAAAPETTLGIDVVLALDLSTSMNAADFRPRDRLHVAREVIDRFIAARASDRIGLVVFAQEAFTQVPLTLDHAILREVLETLETGVIDDGTAIGNALGVSLNRLRDSEASTRLIILLTDGDNNAGNLDPRMAAGFARDLGIRVFPILVGRGGRVPYPVGTDGFGRPRYRQVEIPTNPELLRDIATTTGGIYYEATDRQALELHFQDIIERMEKSRIEDASLAAEVTEWFAAPLAVGLGLLWLEWLLRLGRFRRRP